VRVSNPASGVVSLPSWIGCPTTGPCSFTCRGIDLGITHTMLGYLLGPELNSPVLPVSVSIKSLFFLGLDGNISPLFHFC
jgi:hypothetical protein